MKQMRPLYTHVVLQVVGARYPLVSLTYRADDDASFG